MLPLPVIDEQGLETTLSHLVHEQRQHGGPSIEFRSNVRFGRLPSILENSLYRIAQEALIIASREGRMAWWTFAGSSANAAIAPAVANPTQMQTASDSLVIEFERALPLDSV